MIRLMMPEDAADEFPLELPPYPLYDRVVVVEAFTLTALVAFRWLPIVRWRYLSRAWQGWPPAGERLATDWTGRERELIDWEWPWRAHAWTAKQLDAARFYHEFARDTLPTWPMRYTDPDCEHRPELTLHR